MSAVVLDRLAKHFGPVIALDGVSLTARASERLVLVGPSGCGKTTLLRLVAGLETPTAGTVALDGRDVTSWPARRRDVALVAQQPALYPHLTVHDNLAFGARLHGTPRAERDRRVAEIAELLGLADLLERSPHALSGGQRQRVALGRALVRQPAVFLLDEPFHALDSPLRAGLRAELHLLQRRFQATMIYVTHDPVEALSFGDRVAVLDRGRLRQVGPPLELLEHPADRLVAGRVGWPPMAFVDGHLRSTPEGRSFTAHGLRVALSQAWSALPDGPVVLGVRPEALRLEASGDGWAMEVARVEPLGGSLLLSLRRPGWFLFATAPATMAVMEGQTTGVALNMTQIHLFDSTDGRALPRREAG